MATISKKELAFWLVLIFLGILLLAKLDPDENSSWNPPAEHAASAATKGASND